MLQCPTAMPDTYECSPVRNPRISQDLGLVDVYTIHSNHAIVGTPPPPTAGVLLNRGILGSLQGPATLNEINHYHHERDDQENVNDPAQCVRGD